MAIRQLNPAKLYKKQEVVSYYDHHAAVIDSHQTGSHKVYKGPRGTLKSILTQAAAAGVLGLILAVVVRAVL